MKIDATVLRLKSLEEPLNDIIDLTFMIASQAGKHELFLAPLGISTEQKLENIGRDIPLASKEPSKLKPSTSRARGCS